MKHLLAQDFIVSHAAMLGVMVSFSLGEPEVIVAF